MCIRDSSGGADSVYLLHRLYLLRERMGFRLAAAHYNHQLRGEESRRDEAFVRRFVAQWCGPAQVDGHELPGVPPVSYTHLGVILNESDRMTHIVQDLLTLSRFDSGRTDLKLTQFSFSAVLHDLYLSLIHI